MYKHVRSKYINIVKHDYQFCIQKTMGELRTDFQFLSSTYFVSVEVYIYIKESVEYNRFRIIIID